LIGRKFEQEDAEKRRESFFSTVFCIIMFSYGMHRLFLKASKLTSEIIAAAIEVHKDKGPGLLEPIYEGVSLKNWNCASCKPQVRKL